MPTPLQAITLGYRPFRHRKTGNIEFVRIIPNEENPKKKPEYVEDIVGFVERLEFFREDYEEMNVCEFIRECGISAKKATSTSQKSQKP